MKVYFNHQAKLCEVVVKFGFTDDIFRSIPYDQWPGVELRDAAPDPNEGCLMPPEGATVVMDIPESELLEHEVLADGWEADGFRHAGMGYREFIVPARVANRYDRSLYVECGNCCSQTHDGECEVPSQNITADELGRAEALIAEYRAEKAQEHGPHA